MKPTIKEYPSGLRLIVEPMPSFKSVATSVFIIAGSRDESPKQWGLSHFVEHMLFKGTTTRSAQDIANTLSGLGVDYNAYTSTNATCYHTRGLGNNVDVCCDILSDMYFNLKFSDEDFKREADVICQEIAMRDDHPRLALSELAAETFYADTKYGHNIAGTTETVLAMTPDDIHDYIKTHYVAPKTIISFSGDITVEHAEKLVEKYFVPHFKGSAKPLEQPLTDHKINPSQQFVSKEKDTEQQNVAILFPIMNNNHDERWAMSFVNEIFSSDMSSRLFISVRDKLGLVYSISGGMSLADLGGYYYIYFSCTPKNTSKVLKTINEELKRLKGDGVTEAEVKKVKNIKLAEKLYQGESVEGVNQRNVRYLSEFNRIVPVEEYLENVNKIELADVNRIANKYLNYDNVIVAAVGKSLDKLKPFDFLS